MAIATVNPANGETVKTYDEMSEADVERALAAAAAAAASYPLTGFDDRAEWMRRAAGILDSEQDVACSESRARRHSSMFRPFVCSTPRRTGSGTNLAATGLRATI